MKNFVFDRHDFHAIIIDENKDQFPISNTPFSFLGPQISIGLMAKTESKRAEAHKNNLISAFQRWIPPGN